MCAVTFLCIGCLTKQHDVLGFIQRFLWMWFVAGIVWVVDIACFGGMSMVMNDYGTRPVLSLAGRSSLAILCVHLIEDDVLSWQMILVSVQEVLPQVPLTFTAFVMRLPLDLLLAAALYYVPVINEWFYPQLAKKQLRRKAVVDKA